MVWDFGVHLKAWSERPDGHFPEGTAFLQECRPCAEEVQLNRLTALRRWQPRLDACLQVCLQLLCPLTVCDLWVYLTPPPQTWFSPTSPLQHSSFRRTQQQMGKEGKVGKRDALIREEHCIQHCSNKLLTSAIFSFVNSVLHDMYHTATLI